MHEIPTYGWRHSGKVVFQIHSPVFGLNLPNNISVPQVRVNIREIEHDTIFEIPWNPFRIYKSFHNFMDHSMLTNQDLQCSDYRKTHLSFMKLLPHLVMIWPIVLSIRNNLPISLFLLKKICAPWKFFILVLVIPESYASVLLLFLIWDFILFLVLLGLFSNKFGFLRSQEIQYILAWQCCGRNWSCSGHW